MVGEKTREVIKTIIEEHLQNVTNVLQVFEDFFGEDKVDLQGVPTVSEMEEKFLMVYGETKIEDIASSYTLSLPENIPSTALVKDISDEDLSGIPNILKEILLRLLSTELFHVFIYFPKVRVSNEHDVFIDITELYVRVILDTAGTMVGSFSFNRGEYTRVQYLNDYMHSHACGIPRGNYRRFLDVCLGSGPIRNTVNRLNAHYDLDIWKLFCVELEKYVATESLSGGPYRRLEDVSFYNVNSKVKLILDSRKSVWMEPHLIPMINDFMKYFIKQKKLTFNYRNGGYSIGMSPTEFVILVSNEFIDWFNTTGRYKYTKKVIGRLDTGMSKIIMKVYIIGDTIYKIKDNIEDFNSNEANLGVMGTFKGKEVVVHIAEENDTGATPTIILLPGIISYILSEILKLINCIYGESKSNFGDKSEQGRGTEDSCDQECYYL